MHLPKFAVFFLVSLSLFAAEDRIVRPVDPTRTTILKNHVRPQMLSAADLGPVDPATMVRYATLRLQTSATLETFLAEQRTPSSPNYHRWLTPEQFGDRFGLSQNDLGKLVGWLQSQGLQVHEVARGRHWITFSGTADRIGRAFHTAIHRYRSGGQIHFANATDPAIPSAFEDVVAGIDGLDDFTLQPLYRIAEAASTAGAAPRFNSATTHYLAPDDFATIYDVTPLYNAGVDGSFQNIAVIGESEVDVADIRLFRQTFNLEPRDPQFVLYGPSPGTNSSVIEADLDIEWSGAVARNANIIYVYSNSVTTAVQYAVDQNVAPLITFSYGGCEAFNSGSLRAVAQQANAQGITWLAASGDWGSATCDTTSPTPQAAKGPTASFPATIPEITAVGGTEFNDGNGSDYFAAGNNANGGSALSYVPEMAWNDSALRHDLSAGGGGPSVLYAKPVWQTGPGVPNDNARDTPDVALAASPQHYAYIIYSGDAVVHVGGTSVSSPAFAGILALLNQYLVSKGVLAQPGLGNINPTLYRLAQVTSDIFHDITAGDTRVPCVQGSPACTAAGLGYAAAPGYDPATGLGSVDAYHLVTEWQESTASATTLTAAPSTVSLSDTVQLTATVTGKGGTPTGAVTFVTSDIPVGSATLTPEGTAQFNASASLLAAGDGTVTAVYGGDGVFSGSGATASVSFNVQSTGSLVVPFVTPDPVPQAGPIWPYTVGLTEKAGVATTLTSFTVDGVVQNLNSWSSTHIPAKGTVRASLAGNGLKAPLSRQFAFSGKDADGTTWTQTLSVPFLAAQGQALVPAITLSSPSTIRQNPQADPSCQWSQQLAVQETGGFLIQLNSLTAGGTNLSSQIQTLFGTTRLAPFGMLQATLCFDSNSVSPSNTIRLGGISEVGTAVTANVSASYTSPPASPATLSVSPATVSMTGTGTATVAVSFNGAAVDWTTSILPANRTSGWLTVSPASGTGAGTVTVQVSSDGLAPGVYRALVSIQATDAIPQVTNVPVTLVVGASPALTITGLRDNASGTVAFAPGMQIAVYGSGLAPSVQTNTRIPLPFSLAGVSATVNGVSAPVYAVSDSQVNIQIPYETGAGTAVLGINNNGAVASFPFPVAAAAPGIYNNVIDNTRSAQTGAQPGDVLTIFITGAGDLAPSLATGATPPAGTAIRNLPQPRLGVGVTVGGQPASIAFVGNASGLVGVTQINFTVPATVGAGTQPLVVIVGGSASDPVPLAITTP